MVAGVHVAALDQDLCLLSAVLFQQIGRDPQTRKGRRRVLRGLLPAGTIAVEQGERIRLRLLLAGERDGSIYFLQSFPRLVPIGESLGQSHEGVILLRLQLHRGAQVGSCQIEQLIRNLLGVAVLAEAAQANHRAVVEQDITGVQIVVIVQQAVGGVEIRLGSRIAMELAIDEAAQQIGPDHVVLVRQGGGQAQLR